MSELSLASAFPLAEEAAWKALVEKALKGAPFTSLESKTYDGLVVAPLYGRAPDGAVVPGRAPGTPWEVIQRIEIADRGTANAQILDDLNNGAGGIVLLFQGAVGDRGFGLPSDEAVLKAVLEGVHFEWGVPVELQVGPNAKEIGAIIAKLVKGRGLNPADVNFRFGFDPLGALAANGLNDGNAHDVAALAKDLSAQGFKGPFVVADGRPVHDAGGSEAQELAFALGSALTYLRALEEAGIALKTARRMIFLRLAADQNQFLTAAKFRALRKLWSRVEEACGLAPEPAFVAAETAWRMMTKRDAHGNIVRGTIATLAAAIGGADAVTVLPFSAAIGLPDDFARRVARNTQSVLLEESNLYRVADPSAGSGAMEALTSELCNTAWTLFQEIEAAGGVAEALKAGLIQDKVAEVRAAREAAMARRKDAAVGTSDFPDLGEAEIAVMDAAPSQSSAETQSVTPLKPMRVAEGFEVLRDKSDAILAAHDARPKIFLGCLGRPADFNARASFAKNLFEAGGIEAIAPEAAQSLSDMLAAFRASGASLVCLCSSDNVYESEGASAAKALRHAGAKHIYLAGRPGALESALRDAGVESFVSAGGDALQTLRGAYEHLGD